MSDPSEDTFYAEVGRNWHGILTFAKGLGYELDTVQFKNKDGNVVELSFEQLQSSRGVALLRTAMIGARAVSVLKDCTRCKDRGWVIAVEDCHNSAGIIPCPDCQT